MNLPEGLRQHDVTNIKRIVGKKLNKKLSRISEEQFLELFEHRCFFYSFPKVRFNLFREAKKVLEDSSKPEPDKEVYPCAECLWWHIGEAPSKQTGPQAQARRKQGRKRLEIMEEFLNGLQTKYRS